MMGANRTRGGRPVNTGKPAHPKVSHARPAITGTKKAPIGAVRLCSNRATTPEPLILQRQGNVGPTRRRRQAARTLWRRCPPFPRGAVGLFGITGVCRTPIKNPAGAGFGNTVWLLLITTTVHADDFAGAALFLKLQLAHVGSYIG